MFSIIVAIGKNREIGKKNKLLWHIPEDLKNFKKITTGKTVIMGRKTFESIGRPLPNRKNIVLSKDKSLTVKGATVLNSVDACLDYIKKNNIDDNDVFVIGGESVYNDFLPYCNIAHITYIDYEYEADRHFLNMEKDENWDLILETEEETYFDIPYTFRLYKRNNRL